MSMTEKEAILWIKSTPIMRIEANRKGAGSRKSLLIQALDKAITALEEISLYKQGSVALIPADFYKKQCEELYAYKEIGTVEECKKVMKKIKPKRAIPDRPVKVGAYIKWYYPNCGELQWSGFYHLPITFDNACRTCHQAIDWSK